jgi:hypothetical protein
MAYLWHASFLQLSLLPIQGTAGANSVSSFLHTAGIRLGKESIGQSANAKLWRLLGTSVHRPDLPNLAGPHCSAADFGNLSPAPRRAAKFGLPDDNVKSFCLEY